MLEKRLVPKEGFEHCFEEANAMLNGLNDEIELKVAEARKAIEIDFADRKNRLEAIVASCMEEKEFEVPDEVAAEEPALEEVAEEPASENLAENSDHNEEVIGE